jgi:hypothetical protein
VEVAGDLDGFAAQKGADMAVDEAAVLHVLAGFAFDVGHGYSLVKAANLRRRASET